MRIVRCNILLLDRISLHTTQQVKEIIFAQKKLNKVRIVFYKIRKLAELVQKDYGRCRYMYRLTGPNRLESWFLLTTRFKDNRFDAPFQNRVGPVSFSFYLQRMTQFGLKLQIASWFAVVRSRNSSSYSLGTVLHPRPPRHSRLSDVRNKERLKHKGCSVRDIQANPAVNAMEQESL